MFSVKRVYPHKANNNILFRYGKIPESQFSVPWSSLWWSNYAFKSPAVINCAVNKSKQFAILKIWIFTRTLMSRFRQNDRERAVGIVQAGMSHQAVANHYNVSKITISRLMNRLRQTGRTNDIPHNGRSRVTSQRQDRHLCLIYSPLEPYDNGWWHYP